MQDIACGANDVAMNFWGLISGQKGANNRNSQWPPFFFTVVTVPSSNEAILSPFFSAQGAGFSCSQMGINDNQSRSIARFADVFLVGHNSGTRLSSCLLWVWLAISVLYIVHNRKAVSCLFTCDAM